MRLSSCTSAGSAVLSNYLFHLIFGVLVAKSEADMVDYLGHEMVQVLAFPLLAWSYTLAVLALHFLFSFSCRGM
jgi:hypothetical protein